jgi:hypothetical protein
MLGIPSDKNHTNLQRQGLTPYTLWLEGYAETPQSSLGIFQGAITGLLILINLTSGTDHRRRSAVPGTRYEMN